MTVLDEYEKLLDLQNLVRIGEIRGEPPHPITKEYENYKRELEAKHNFKFPNEHSMILSATGPKTHAMFFKQLMQRSGKYHIIIDQLLRCEVIITKPDLLGNSKWEVFFHGNGKIDVSITDKEFLSKVKSREIQFSSGDRLVCDLLISTTIDDRYNVINAEHTITQVHKIKDDRDLTIWGTLDRKLDCNV